MAKIRVTEEDLRLTEALIGQSFARVKASVAEAPHELVRPATSAIREHPFIAAAAATGVGVAAFQVLRMLTPRVVVKEVATDATGEVREARKGADLTSQAISLVTPYIMGYLQQELAKWVASREQHR